MCLRASRLIYINADIELGNVSQSSQESEQTGNSSNSSNSEAAFNMQSTRPSRKRAGTSTNATPPDPARRIRLGSSPEPDRDDKGSNITNWLHNHDPSQNVARTSPIPIPIYSDYPTKYITPPTPCSSPELQRPSYRQAGIDPSGYSIISQRNRPGYNTTYRHRRNEFPFPIQPLPRQLRNIRRLELTIPEEPEPGKFDIDIDIPIPSSTPIGKRTGRPERPYVHPLPTPPRSHPSVPTCFSYSPPSSYGQQPPTPTPSSTTPSSGLPSLSSSSPHSYSHPYSPMSPNTPSTPTAPLTRFNSAAAALKLVLMANEIGMSLQELEGLNEFAAAPMSGDSKRAGRVLVRRDFQQRREKGTEKSGDGVSTGGQDMFHRREDCRSENCGRHATMPVPGGMWKDVEWSRSGNGNGNRSRFSDSTVSDDMDVDVDGDKEMTALDGYIRMAVDADADTDTDADADGDGRRSSSIVNVSSAVFGTAEVGRRIRPAGSRMKTSVERVEAAVGPLGERL